MNFLLSKVFEFFSSFIIIMNLFFVTKIHLQNINKKTFGKQKRLRKLFIYLTLIYQIGFSCIIIVNDG